MKSPQHFLKKECLNRREFIAASTLAVGAAASLPQQLLAADPKVTEALRFPIIAFSKPFQKLNPKLTADLVSEVDWDGIECPVRPGGQVEPEQAPDQLPAFAEALRSQKRDIYIVTTHIVSPKTTHAEKVLRAVASLGIKRIRLGFISYSGKEFPPDRLKEIAPELRDLNAMLKDLGLRAGYQNHSGRNMVGAPVWDMFSVIHDLDHIGFCFDIGHATLEGGLSWPIEARLAEPHLTAVFVKDFLWKKTGKAWKDEWCPLGEGLVKPEFFEWLKKSSYRGPISQHHEYELGDSPEMMTAFKKDLKVLKEWMA